MVNLGNARKQELVLLNHTDNRNFSKTEGLMSKNIGPNMPKDKKLQYPKYNTNAINTEYIKTQSDKSLKRSLPTLLHFASTQI